MMASRLQKIREYWQATADTREKLIVSLPVSARVVFEYKANKDIIKPANDLIPSTPKLTYELGCILASDINLPFEWAEAVVKLRSIERPRMILQNSWLEIKAACTQLYMDDFSLLKLIINNGWSLEEVYGCNKFAPLVRVDCMGLLLLLHQGDEVVGVSKERIQILHRSGKINYLYRKLDQQMKVSSLYELAADC